MNLIRTTADLGNNAIDMDNLTYTYQNGNNNSNRLMRVEDSTSVFDTNGFLNGNSGTDDYAYDANGNMTKDKNKDITSIEYNYLNLPTEITFGSGNSIEYIYNAAGVKVHKTVTDISKTPADIYTDYLDGFQYVGGMLNFFPTAEGYVRATSQTEDPADPQLVFNYVYNYTDHLGNIRLSYTKDPVSNELDILEENNYYPFGLKHKIYGGIKKDYLKEEPGNGGGGAIRPGVVIDGPYNYKYNGKEFQDELNLNLYDFHARNYDPTTGRTNTMDPLADIYSNTSPYSFFNNNPVFFIDPTGMAGEDWKQDSFGNYVYDEKLTAENASTQLGEGETYIGESASFGVAQDGEQVGTVNLNADGTASYTQDGQTVEFDNTTVDLGFESGHTIKTGSWQTGDTFSKGNWVAGAAATGLEYTPGTFRVGTTTQGFSPKYYGNSWGGNQYAKTFNIGKIGKGLGYFGAAVGTAVDIYGVRNYYKYGADAPNAVHPAKASLNAGMTAYGIWVNPIAAALYGGIDAFYPGGWVGASQTAAQTEANERAMTGHSFFSNSALKQ